MGLSLSFSSKPIRLNGKAPHRFAQIANAEL